MIAKVTIGIPFSNPFDYLIFDEFTQRIKIGMRVLVPFGPRELVGVVVKIQDQSEIEKLKPIIDIVDEAPVYSQYLLELTGWIAEYYLCSWGEVLETALPTGLKPRIEKRIIIDKACESFNELPEEEQQWLVSIENRTESAVFKDPKQRSLKKRFLQLRKAGCVMFNHKLVGNHYKGEAEEEWLVLQPDRADQVKTKKGSKTDILWDIIQKEKKIRRKDLNLRLQNSGPAINQLLKKNAINREMLPVDDSYDQPVVYNDRFIRLNEKQELAVGEISRAINDNIFQPFLLHGVTGSGKTEVYLYAVKETIQLGKSALILIPEISLTPQAVRRFRDRFGDRTAVLHSGMAEKDRSREWWRIKSKKCDIVIGARSAIFAPLSNIGLIVVDEEHDSSYKQQETPFYNARDVAVKIASTEKAVVVLGSATPSIESFFNIQIGKYKLLTLPERANLKPLPSAEVVNLKEEKRQSGAFYLSKYLYAILRENYQAGKQALIFLNRRGYASFLSCKECELPVLCNNCSIAMTWHTTSQHLICHHCGYTRPYPQICNNCHASAFKMEGIGTQRVERDLKALFPRASFLRMDRDTIQKKGALEKYIDLINDHKVDFIVGTQLISKGHDFKHIGIVCIVLADMSLNIPDFRSTERSFQLISQVSGRAGRDELGVGKALIQSYNPDHFAIRSANDHDYLGFYNQEIQYRKDLVNPPFTRQILLRVSDSNPSHVQMTAEQLGEILKKQTDILNFQVFGPVESPIQKINNRYYWHILLKGEKSVGLKKLLYRIFWTRSDWRPKGSTRISIDVDPYVMI